MKGSNIEDIENIVLPDNKVDAEELIDWLISYYENMGLHEKGRRAVKRKLKELLEEFRNRE